MSYANSTAIICVASVMPALSIVVVAGRFYVRKQQKQGFAADDWLILPALVVTVGMGMLLLYGTLGVHNLGYPIEDFTPTSDSPQIVTGEQIEMALYIMQAVALGLAKLSVTCFYRRIFNTGGMRAFDIFTKILLFIIFGWSLAWVLSYIFACGDRVYLQWSSYESVLENCGDAVVETSFFFVSDLVIDIVLFIIPIPLIARLNISKSRRFTIMLIFCMNTLAAVVSIFRIAFLALIYQHKVGALSTADQDLEISIFGFWTMLEVGMSVVATCLPTFSVWVRSVSTVTIFKHVRGFFSTKSLSVKSLLGRRSDASSTGERHLQDHASGRSILGSEKGDYITEL